MGFQKNLGRHHLPLDTGLTTPAIEDGTNIFQLYFISESYIDSSRAVGCVSYSLVIPILQTVCNDSYQCRLWKVLLLGLFSCWFVITELCLYILHLLPYQRFYNASLTLSLLYFLQLLVRLLNILKFALERWTYIMYRFN